MVKIPYKKSPRGIAPTEKNPDISGRINLEVIFSDGYLEFNISSETQDGDVNGHLNMPRAYSACSIWIEGNKEGEVVVNAKDGIGDWTKQFRLSK